MPDAQGEGGTLRPRSPSGPDLATIPSPTILALHRGEREGCSWSSSRSTRPAVGRGRARGARHRRRAGRRPARARAGRGVDPLAGPAVRDRCAAAAQGAGRSRRGRRLQRRAAAAAARPRAREVPVLGIDPGFAPGCRLAVVDADGGVVEHDTVFPLQPKQAVPQAKARLAELRHKHESPRSRSPTPVGPRARAASCARSCASSGRASRCRSCSSTPTWSALLAAARGTRDELGEEAPLRRAVACARRLRTRCTSWSRSIRASSGSASTSTRSIRRSCAVRSSRPWLELRQRGRRRPQPGAASRCSPRSPG